MLPFQREREEWYGWLGVSGRSSIIGLNPHSIIGKTHFWGGQKRGFFWVPPKKTVWPSALRRIFWVILSHKRDLVFVEKKCKNCFRSPLFSTVPPQRARFVEGANVS